MPEGPEVRITTEHLSQTLTNKIITDWFLCEEGTVFPGYNEMHKELPLIVEEVMCKGKTIFMSLHNEHKRFYVVHSLRMTGRWQEKEDDHCRCFIEYNDTNRIYLRDPRRMATIKFLTDEDLYNHEIDRLGPDIFSDNFSLPLFKSIWAKYKDRNITSFLMDQSLLAGIGNYLKAEILYYAGISPLRKIGSLTDREIDKLYEGIKIIPRLSYNSNGMTAKDYLSPDGSKGDFVSQLKIYGKSFAKKTKTPDGRITHWCPNRQI